uniref:HNH nuclease domain-containing protein n=1 Tax=Lotharella globosa TaxID=91324 RepID=A0A7S3Z8T7_9EUKA
MDVKIGTVQLSDGRDLTVYRGVKGREYYKDNGRRKTLRINQNFVPFSGEESPCSKEKDAKQVKSNGAENALGLTNKPCFKLKKPDNSPVPKLYPEEPTVNHTAMLKREALYNMLIERGEVKIKGPTWPERDANRFVGEESDPTDTRLRRVDETVDLAPNYFLLMLHYKNNTCPYTGEKHQVCRVEDPDSKRHRRPGLKQANSWLTQVKRFSGGFYGRPANTEVDHILPLCMGGPDCWCNFQLLTREEHRFKTNKYDLRACKFYGVRI